MSNDFNPRIIIFACNWCAYAGADLAGVSRLQYPPNSRTIRIMCTARVSPAIILKAFERGIDGVIISGWHPGECHYLEGNMKAEKVVAMTKRLMRLLGIEDERLRLEWISASEGARFAETVTSFTEQISRTGRSPLRSKIEDQRISLSD